MPNSNEDVLEAVHVIIDGDVREKEYAATFGSFNTYPIAAGAGPMRILPRRKERDRAVVWVASSPDADTGVILASSQENAQQGIGGLLTIAGQQISIESQQDVWAIFSGSAGTTISLSVHDETWMS